MLHVHLIITAILLLLGAFIGLILCFCVDVIPIIKSRGSTLVSRDTVTREQARVLKKSLQKNVPYLSAKSDTAVADRKATAGSNVYESNQTTKTSDASIMGVSRENRPNGSIFSPQTVSVIVEPTPASTCSDKCAHHHHHHHITTCCQRSTSLPLTAPNTPGQYRAYKEDPDRESCQPLLIETQQTVTTYNEIEKQHHQLSNGHLNHNPKLSHKNYSPSVCTKRCSCGAMLPTQQPLVGACTNNRSTRHDHANAGCNRAWASWKHQQRRLHVNKKTMRASRNSSPYSSSSASSSSSGSGRRTRVTRLEDIQEDEDQVRDTTESQQTEEQQGAQARKEDDHCVVVVEKTPCTLESDVICISNDDRELLQYVDTKNSITTESDNT